MTRVVKAADLDQSTTPPDFGEVVVVAATDGESAAQAADTLTGPRTAVFVGDLDLEGDRQAAEELAAELEAGIRPPRD